MTWNYQILHHPDGNYALHEVFVDEDESALPHSWTSDAVDFSGETPAAIITSLANALADARKMPVLRIVTDADGAEQLEKVTKP